MMSAEEKRSSVNTMSIIRFRITMKSMILASVVLLTSAQEAQDQTRQKRDIQANSFGVCMQNPMIQLLLYHFLLGSLQSSTGVQTPAGSAIVGGLQQSPGAGLQSHKDGSQQSPLEDLQRLLSQGSQLQPVVASPVWSYYESPTTYTTEVTKLVSNKLPIFFRGRKITTTIVTTDIETITTTDTLTKSMLVTPTRFPNINILPTFSPATNVIPVNKDTEDIRPTPSFETLDLPPATQIPQFQNRRQPQRYFNPDDPNRRLSLQRRSYGSSPKSSDNRRINRFKSIVSGDGIKPDLKNPDSDKYDTFDEVEDDQDLLPSEEEEYSTKIYTLFLPGSLPGEYTTSETTITLNNEGSVIRNKREISSNVVAPILKTAEPHLQNQYSVSFADFKNSISVDNDYNLTPILPSVFNNKIEPQWKNTHIFDKEFSHFPIIVTADSTNIGDNTIYATKTETTTVYKTVTVSQCTL